MDTFLIHGIVEELKKEITGAFITKVYQMNRTDLLFRFRRAGEDKQLLISTHPDFHRLHLTQKKYANPLVPPRFCTYLRKHTIGARVADVSQDPYERVVRFRLQKRMDADLFRDLILVIELTGKNSNVLLLEINKILDCLHFRPGEEAASRPALPGSVYTLPPSAERCAPPAVKEEMMQEIARSPAGERWRSLAQRISGLSPLLAREIEFTSDGTSSGLWGKFRELFNRYERGDFEPRIITLLGEKKILSPFPLKSLGPAGEETYPSMNETADQYYFEVVTKRQMGELKQGMNKRLRHLLSRLKRRKENLLSDQEDFQKDLELKAYGDILTANYPRIKKGMREIEALDYRQDPPRSILIPLDETLHPSGNVQRYFRKYKKAKRGLEATSQRISETEREIAYVESVLFQTEAAEGAEELEAIRKELEEERILSPSKNQKSAREKQETSLPVRRFRSSEGLEIFCGKHNMGNDYLLRRLAKDNDLWFHAQGLPGSHVVLRVGKGEPTFESILEAATIAAYYSRGRDSTRLPVDYTQVKNVRRPKGAKPGMVNYFHQRTVVVQPEKEKMDRLLKD